MWDGDDDNVSPFFLEENYYRQLYLDMLPNPSHIIDIMDQDENQRDRTSRYYATPVKQSPR